MTNLEDRVTPATFTVLNTNDTGTGSLRQAVTDANTTSGADTIVFDATAFATPQTISVNGQMSITEAVTVNGPASKVTLNSTAAAGTTSRVFDINGTGVFIVGVSNLIISGGNLSSGNGAGINIQDEQLVLTDSVVTNNKTAGEGGGLNIQSTGVVNLVRTTLSNNTATSDGGGINVQGVGTFTVTDSTVSGNSSGDDGGGVYFNSGGTFIVDRGTFSGNKAGTGTTSNDGGAAYLFGTVTSTITNSTFSGNQAGRGGALAILSTGNTTTIRNSTITANTALGTGGTNAAGGITRTSTGTLTLVSTIVAGNTFAAAPDISVSGGTMSASNSLIGATDGLTITGSNNKTGTNASPLNPQLGVLADNGGLTMTHAPQAGSPALDNGSNANGFTTDQRGPGYVRSFGTGPDIGSLEVQPVGLPTATGAAANVTLPGGTTYTFTVKYEDLTGTNNGLKAATIIGNNAAVAVTGPGSFTTAATYVGIDVGTDGTPRTATYSFTPPGGAWDGADNGTYSVQINANQVFDKDSNPIPAGSAGTFSVLIPQTFLVSNTNDSGNGSLRQAVLASNTFAAADQIAFDPSVFGTTPQTINLTSGELAITDALTITGPGAGLLTISGVAGTAGATNRIFNIDGPGTSITTISGVTLTGGNLSTGNGGAILIQDDNVTLNDVVVTGNTTAAEGGAVSLQLAAAKLTLNRTTLSNNTTTGAGDGGAINIQSQGTVTLVDSTISGNTAAGDGGAMYFFSGGTLSMTSSTLSGNKANGANGGGAIYFFSTPTNGFTITNSTISGNSAVGIGGGIVLRSFGGVANIRNSTITKNTTTEATNGGGGIGRNTTGGTIQLYSTVIAGNTSSAGKAADIWGGAAGATVNADRTFFGSDEGLTVTGANNITGGTNASPQDAKLGALASNGGPTQTHAVLPNSPLRNAGANAFFLTTDQRGRPRTDEGQTDIGAFEFTPPRVASITTAAADPSNTTSVDFTVTFTDPVTSGLSATNFAVNLTGSATGTVGSVTPIGLGLSYTVQVTGISGTGTIQLSVVNGTGAQPGLVGAFPVNGPVHGVDLDSPTVSISLAGPNPTNAATVDFTVAYSEPVTGLNITLFTLASSGLSGVSFVGLTGGPAVYTLTAGTGTGSGTLALGIALGAQNGVRDLAGNQLTGSFPLFGPSYTIDKIAPTATVTRSGSSASNAATVAWTVAFSEPVVGLSAANFTLPASVTGASVASVTGGPTSYTVNVNTGTGDGFLGLTLANSTGLSDVAGNPVSNLQVAGALYTIDKTAPTVVITRLDADPTNASVVSWSVQFDELVSTVTFSNFTLAAAGLTGSSFFSVQGGSQGSYIVRATTGSGDGTLALNLTSSAGLSDAAGNPVAPTVGEAYAVDRVNPTATVTRLDPNPTGLAVVHYQVQFSEAVSGLTAADLNLVTTGISNAAITAVTPAGANAYTVTVNTGTGDGTLRLDVTNSAGITDLVGNPLNGGATVVGQVYDLDKSPPTVTAIDLNDPLQTNLGAVSWTITFRKDVFNVDVGIFGLDAVGVTGAAITGVTGGGKSYVVTAATGTGDGSLGLSVTGQGAVVDVAGNPIPPASLPFRGPAYTIDKTDPTLTIDADSPSPTNSAVVSWTVVFDEAVLGVTAADFSLVTTGLSGAAITNVVGGGDTYFVTASTGSGDGTIGLNLASASGLADVAGNPVDPATLPVVGGVVTVDKTSPFVLSFTRNGPSLTSAAVVSWTITFSEPVYNIFDTQFTTVETGVTGSAFAYFGGLGTSYTIYVSTGTGDGTVALRLANSTGLTDVAGNQVSPTPVTGAAFDIDKTPPVVTILANGPATTNANTVSWSVLFSEPVMGLSTNFFYLLTGNGLTPSALTGVTGSGASYTVTAATGTGDGIVTLAIPPGGGGVVDAAGNNPVPIPQMGPSFHIDKVAPTVAIARIGFSPTNAGPISWRVVFSEPVTGLSEGNFTLAQTGVTGATITSVTGSGTTYTVVADTGSGDGTIGLTLANSTGLSDLAGNPAGPLPITAAPYAIDNTAPTVTLSTTATDPTPQSTFLVTAAFSEPVVGFAASDIFVTNGTATGFTVVGPNEYRFTVTANSLGPVTVSIPAHSLSDSAGNLLAVAGSLTRTVNTPNPTPTLASTIPNPVATPFGVAVVFDQPVTGFTAADVIATNATVADFTAVGPTVYTFTLVPLADGLVGATIPAGAAVNGLGLPSNPVTVPPVQFDGTAPTVAVARPSGQPEPTKSLPVTFLVNFTEPVFGFDASDLVLGGSAPGARVAAVSGAGSSYTVTVNGLTDTGTVTLGVKAGAATDAAGNPSAAANALTLTYVNPASPPPVTHTPPPLPDRIAVGFGAGNQVQIRDAAGASIFEGEVFPTGFSGGVRVASADFNGDGTPDVVVGTGPGMVTQVRVLDGRTHADLFAVQPFEASFTGGVFVAAGDVTGDGVADLVITPDETGGPRVRVFSGNGFGLVADFLGIDDPNFRGGARASVGDFNGDGRGDLAVAAGISGGPRVALFDGGSLGGTPARLVGDFFVFEQSLRNGAFVAAGDVDGDGFADVIAGGGPGGAPRVFALSGQALTQSRTQVQVANFFAGNTADRGGVRLSVANLDGDNRADIVAGAGEGGGTTVVAYLGKNVPTDGTPATGFVFEAFPGLKGGVYVG